MCLKKEISSEALPTPMANILSIYLSLLQGLMKMIGMSPVSIEVEPGTVMHFWAPTESVRGKPNHQNHRKRSKPAVVLLHGFALNGILTWQFQVLALAKDYAIYVPDFLFFGNSFTDKSERSTGFQAECVAKGLRKLGIEKCGLVGFSYGGMVGFKMTEMYPELVESMVIHCSVMALTESITRVSLDRTGFSSWDEFLLPDNIQGVKKMLGTASYKLPWMPNFFYKHALEVMFDYRKERSELLDALVVKDRDFNCPNYPQKISLLWGEKDVIFNMELARNLQELLGGRATLHCIEKAGHLAQVERPFVYNSYLKRILAS